MQRITSIQCPGGYEESIPADDPRSGGDPADVGKTFVYDNYIKKGVTQGFVPVIVVQKEDGREEKVLHIDIFDLAELAAS